jgi:hypothetical protein
MTQEPLEPISTTSTKQAAIAITKQDLADIVAAAVRAAKEPTVIEQKKIDEEKAIFDQKQERRRALAKNIRAETENKKRLQAACSHEQPNGGSRAPYISERSGPGYMICLKCTGKVRPGPKPANPDFGCVYDTALFNRLFQKAQAGSEVYA